jgi:hypothetical protein
LRAHSASRRDPDFDLSTSLDPGVHAFGVDSVLRRLDKDGSSPGLSAFYTFQKLAQRHLKGLYTGELALSVGRFADARGGRMLRMEIDTVSSG